LTTSVNSRRPSVHKRLVTSLSALEALCDYMRYINLHLKRFFRDKFLIFRRRLKRVAFLESVKLHVSIRKFSFFFCDGHVTTFRHPSGAYIFRSKPSVKVEIKTTWEVVTTCEVLWSARLNTSKVTANRQEDRSSQWEATKKSVGLRQQGWSSSTEIDLNDGERRLFDISSAVTSGVWDWTADIVTVIDIATSRWRLKSSWALNYLFSLVCRA